ncbi:MAG: gliding motility-associated ABC transporter permease subunit GldF [Flavobacteriales bacterium]|nr:gliding motility-associated ABC transporter permease subunit GldF [Flavobacteriales bacterium]
MIALLKKEINSFLGSLIGYIVIFVFLIAMGMFMWIFPGDSNILDNGYANIDTLFIIGPWIFMFLVPAVTMRLFAEEKRLGTIELLFTQPISDMGIILAKYFAGLLLVIFSVVPTLIYAGTIYYLGNPAGNLDIGGLWGSYVGLVFLGAGFVAIGVFCSAITDNQIISFVVAVFLSFFFYTGFDSISSIFQLGGLDSIILNLGIQEHYLSMSRGVLDTRDILYFISLIVVFLLFTKVVLDSRKW